MSIANCTAQIAKALGSERWSESRVKEAVETIERRARNRIRRDHSIPYERALLDAATELGEEAKYAAAVEKRSRLINRMRSQEREAFYARYEATGGTRAEAIRAKVVGREGNVYGAGDSTDAQGKALALRLVGSLQSDLRAAGLLEAAKMKDPNFELAVAREMARANGNKNVPATGDKMAEQFAAIAVKHQRAGIAMQNQAGAAIAAREGYVVRQTHDAMKVRRAAGREFKFDDPAHRKAWVEFVRPLLDERTFDDADDIDKFLGRVYSNLAASHHQKLGSTDPLGGFTGPSNLAKKVSQGRVLIFKGPDEEVAYNRRFGTSSVYETLVDSLERAGRNTALLRVWGTNPEAAWQADIDKAIAAAKEADRHKEIDELTGRHIRAEFETVARAYDVGHNMRLASMMASIRLGISMAKLGAVTVASIPDVGTRAAVMRHNGINLLEATGNVFESFFTGHGNSEKRKVSDLIGAGIQGTLSGILGRFHATDNAPARLTKAANVFFKLTGLTQWTDALSRGFAWILSRELANNVGSSFDALPKRHQTTLRRYGIEANEWDIIRQGELFEADGRKYLLSDGIDVLPDHLFGATPRAAERARDLLKTKLATYYSDQVNESMTVPGAREKAYATLGLRTGTAEGEAIRFIMQFKQYPITFTSRHLRREFARDGVDWGGLGQLIATTTVLGGVSLIAKELMKGRMPRQPENAEQWGALFVAAMLQGGGLGLYGDFLLQDTNRFGGSLAENLGGPGISLASDVVRVLQAAAKGEDPSAKAFKTALSWTPYANLFYTRMALDYLILHAIQDALNPGYLRRVERKVERETGQQFWWRPSEDSLFVD